ncbi:heme-binding protein [Caballeronia mineralivorans]|jgi:glc operon protein GlcG|uniref:GlcG/HbpS family heme-binding protein n=1 Tax=Caballeronia mineralivorans TaxID=2010198 RepID=UPI002AFEA6F1|nr:heme-binding protein [Caballeronia mineralivorans]MEA3103416.1 glc operon protein GlcG [Caballeronia mineralivorans]
MANVELALELAQRLLDHCVAQARERFGKPVCAAVCDAQGFLIGFARADGAPVRSIALSQQKAYTSARIGSTTMAFLERLRREDIPIGYFCDALLTALPGGALIEDGTGRAIGAVGISGLTPAEDQLLADAGTGFVQLSTLRS